MVETTGNRMMQIHTIDKPFKITKSQVYKAYKAVKSNAGAVGVDGQTIERVMPTCRETSTSFGIE
jgi:hypothetical protein